MTQCFTGELVFHTSDLYVLVYSESNHALPER